MNKKDLLKFLRRDYSLSDFLIGIVIVVSIIYFFYMVIPLFIVGQSNPKCLLSRDPIVCNMIIKQEK